MHYSQTGNQRKKGSKLTYKTNTVANIIKELVNITTLTKSRAVRLLDSLWRRQEEDNK